MRGARMTVAGRPSAFGGPSRPPTMKDVAVAAGVAQSTVSRVLNHVPGAIGVTEATRRRVRKVVEDLGYQPHPGARALRGAPTMLLGAVVRDITDPFFAEAIHELSIEASERGYSVVLAHARVGRDEAVSLTAALKARHCDAMVLLGDFGDEPRLLEELRKVHVPVVALWHGGAPQAEGLPTVGVDNRFGVRAALAHLAALGHRRIAFVGTDAHGDIREREATYEKYHSGVGIATPAGYICHVPNDIAGAKQAFGALRALNEPPSAIVASTDLLALGLIHAANEGSVAVPSELSIVGFDDIPLAAAAVPGLTTVRMPVKKIVAAGVALAIGDRAQSNDGPLLHPPRVIFKPRLIVRGSTSPAGGTGLGLAISRELMGGTINVASKPGHGSTFRAELELEGEGAGAAAGERPRNDTSAPVWLTEPLVLVAEDSPVNQLVVARALERIGCRCEIVSDGYKALEAIQRGHYDAVLMDCQMPNLDGFQATGAIRRLDGASARVPVIAMTARAMDDDRTRCLAAGMDDYLSKPMRRAALAEMMHRWIPATPAEAGSARIHSRRSTAA
jgi:DNA-binding LacI/PurR family transcriptional regulator/ActR/RegA family two-component response regulator